MPLVLIGLLFSMTANAVQLGGIRGHSHIGEPLDATIAVWLTATDRAQPIRFKVTPDIVYRSNARLTALVDGLSVSLESAGPGRPYLRVVSDGAIDEPVLPFRLKVYVGDTAVMRNYAIALAPAPAHVAAPTRSIRPARTRAPIDTTSYTVESGDTLWAIARRVSASSGANTNALVQEIFELNPHAFVGGNRDRLKLGAALTLPSANPVAMTPAVPAADGSTPRPETRVAAPAAAPSVDTVEAPPAIPEPAPAKRARVDWRERKPDVAAELEALRLKYIALKAQYDLQSSDERRTAASAEPVTQDPVVTLPSLPATADEPVEATVTDTLEAPASVTRSPAPVSRTVPADTTESIWHPTLVVAVPAAIAVIALLVLGYIVVHNTLRSSRRQRAERDFDAREADFKAEVARKAASRIQMEDEVQRMLANRTSGDAGTRDAPPADSGSEDDPEREIDHAIAHGRYTEAEAQLREVIANTPKNFNAKLRLAEVYYMTERVDDFCSTAIDLRENHRADMTDEEWRRIVRMGKIVAPDRVPFSGPRAVDGSHAAS